MVMVPLRWLGLPLLATLYVTVPFPLPEPPDVIVIQPALGEAVHWQPRVVCPKCNSDSLEWIDLPTEGALFAFTEVRAGAPLGMEQEVPFVTGLVRLADTEILITSRIDGAKYEELKIGDRVRLRTLDLPDGRVWFRFVPLR